jgi:hypothetical protein
VGFASSPRGLEKHRLQMHLSVDDANVSEALEKFKELRRVNDGVWDRRRSRLAIRVAILAGSRLPKPDKLKMKSTLREFGT